ncbi:heterokaryon incompatibility, partial [Leptodontidium sp. 2 PMI_412]
GPIKPEQVIHIDEQEVSIRPNLCAALHAIRDRRNVTIIWVDALCINQEDIPERSEQVRWMGDIYRTAYRVLVWLGDAGDDSDMLFDYQSQRFAGPIDGNRKARLKTAFEALCSRPYWRRVWIIQEVLIA